jgi:hypothetical protein
LAELKFAEHGYALPQIVFQYLCDSASISITTTENVIMVSDFSGNLLKVISGCDLNNMTPELFLNKVIEA